VESAWAEFVPFLQFDTSIRSVVCTTNAIESINARIRRAVNARGHFPTDAAALKCVYLAIMSLDPTGRGRKRWTNRWKEALNAFDITFDGRLSAARTEPTNHLHRYPYRPGIADGDNSGDQFGHLFCQAHASLASRRPSQWLFLLEGHL
jgi:hypothetical protein